MNPVRQGAAWVYRILITLFAAAIVVEVFLAGLGIFRAMPGEEEFSRTRRSSTSSTRMPGLDSSSLADPFCS